MKNPKIDDIIARMKALDQELQAELEKARERFRYKLEGSRIFFERDILAQQKKFKEGLLRYIFHARLRHVLTAPVVYAVAIPLVLLDIMVTLYQHICFRAYGIPRVKRSDYLVYDRNRLGYLNLIEKLNCYYCAYGNGIVAYFREVFARTEQYWCPIKHAHKRLAAHDRYPKFLDFGDAEGYRRDLEKQRSDFEN